MQIKLNGQPKLLPEPSDIHALLQSCQLTPDKVAVEVNKRLVRSIKYDTLLRDGDEVEIVTFVGGG